jgi:hypothetical protein
MVLTSASYGVSLSRRTDDLLSGAVPSLPSFE